MGSPNSTSKLEMISLYLDQELDDSDILHFAEQLTENQTFKQDFLEMQSVKQKMRKIPMETPPRNYILTRAMAHDARKPSFFDRLIPFMRSAAAICTILFVVSFAYPWIQTEPLNAEYVAKSAPISEIAQIHADLSMDSARDSIPPLVRLAEEFDSIAGETSTEVTSSYRPSHGVRGGTPRNEILMGAENDASTNMATFSTDAFAYAQMYSEEPQTDTGIDNTVLSVIRRDSFRYIFGLLSAFIIGWLTALRLSKRQAKPV